MDLSNQVIYGGNVHTHFNKYSFNLAAQYVNIALTVFCVILLHK